VLKKHVPSEAGCKKFNFFFGKDFSIITKRLQFTTLQHKNDSLKSAILAETSNIQGPTLTGKVTCTEGFYLKIGYYKTFGTQISNLL